MIILTKSLETGKHVVGILDSSVFAVGHGSTIGEAYQNAKADKDPFPILHLCETEADILNLQHTHPELFL